MFIINVFSDNIGQTSIFATRNESIALESNTSVKHENWLRYKTEKWIKLCEGSYVREPCTRHIEHHVCHKYKFDFHGSIDVPCMSNKNTSLILKTHGWISLDMQCHINEHYNGFLKSVTTDEHYFLHNITEQRLNQIFKFNETLNNLCIEYKNSELPCCRGNCKFYVRADGGRDGRRPLYDETCGQRFDKLLDINETFILKYKKVMSYVYTPKNILCFFVNMIIIMVSMTTSFGILAFYIIRFIFSKTKDDLNIN